MSGPAVPTGSGNSPSRSPSSGRATPTGEAQSADALSAAAVKVARRLRALLLVLGVVVLAVGAVAVFVSTNDTGSAGLVAAGAVLVCVGVFADRITAVEAAGLKLELIGAGQDKFEQADAAEAAGDPARAGRLRSEGKALLEAAASIASRYDRIRTSQPSSFRRTQRLHAVAAEAGNLPSDLVTPEGIEQIFAEGSEGARVAALTLMRVNPAATVPRLLAEAIEDSLSGMQQYEALRCAQAVLPSLGAADRTFVLGAVERALAEQHLQEPGSDRRRLALSILGRS